MLMKLKEKISNFLKDHPIISKILIVCFFPITFGALVIWFIADSLYTIIDLILDKEDD